MRRSSGDEANVIVRFYRFIEKVCIPRKEEQVNAIVLIYFGDETPLADFEGWVGIVAKWQL